MMYLIMECGSSARGDTNASSDRDVVCIWQNESPDFKALRALYGEVMTYSIDTLRRMKKKGSLFLVHLDVDGVWLDGDLSLLDEIRGFRPAPEMVQKGYQNTKKFIREISWYPLSHQGYLWLLDALYVALRSCVYSWNATQGQYVFGLVEALQVFGLSDRHLATMLLIREGKYSYRRSNTISKELPLIQDVEDVCKEILNCNVSFKCGGRTDWQKNWLFDYWDERFIERAILNGEHRSVGFMEKMRRHNYFKSSLRKEIGLIVDEHKGTASFSDRTTFDS